MTLPEEPSDRDRKLILDFIALEYERLSTDIRENVRNAFTGFSLLAVVAGATVYAAFIRWDSPLVASMLLVILVPALILAAINIWLINLFTINTKVDYIREVLERRVDQLLGPALEGWLATTSKATGNSETQRSSVWGDPGSAAHFESLRRKVWGWDGWSISEPFRIMYKPEFAWYRLLLILPGFFVLLAPLSMGYVRIFSSEGWKTVGMASIFHPARFTLVIAPVVVMVGVAIMATFVVLKTKRFSGKLRRVVKPVEPS